jgi:uncharacterized membrane protein YgaE (UPF0421/DUF939 family)
VLSARDARNLVKIALAAGLAWWLGNLLGQPQPVFASIVPVLVIRPGATATLRGSIGRIIGVLAGVGVGLAALAVASPSAVLVGVVVGVSLLIDRVLRALPRLEIDTRNQTAISALLMLFVTSSVTAYGGTRAWETALGAAIALSADTLDSRLPRLLRRDTRTSGDPQAAA